MNRTQKAEAVAAIAARLSTTSNVIATTFRGLSVREVEELRSRLRENGGRMQVVKNTLARRACAETGTESLLEHLEGPTALVWADGDAAVVAKALQDFGTKSGDRLALRGGLLEGIPISGDELKRLAALPSRDELYARLVSGVARPLTGTAFALSNLISGLARSLAAVQAQRASEPADD